MKRTGECGRNVSVAGMTRREALGVLGNGFGMVALSALFAEEAGAAPSSHVADPRSLNPLTIRPPHFAPRAKRVIFLFMSGGPSHVDLFDPKPRLQSDTGKPLPFAMPALVRTKTGNLLGSPFSFK